MPAARLPIRSLPARPFLHALALGGKARLSKFKAVALIGSGTYDGLTGVIAPALG
jgi:hypothetical protein